MMARKLVAAGALLAAGIAAGAAGDPPYRVDGNKVDEATLKGWKAWRALACDRCHGKDQEGEGAAGPSLNDGLKTMTREEFRSAVLAGRVDKGMPNFDGSKMAVDNIDNLYAYLKGRSDGAIPGGRLELLP
ncbi:MAG TPA: cytochrome c [Anaeromyxobacteraceae bacterium]|nr:cytochrome c [Anaeromyxobacteraceae bacterium]